MRAFLKDQSYFLMMGSGAALGLLRGFVMAAILAVSDFGTYAIVVAAGSLLSVFISLGKIEETRKEFPRMIADGYAHQTAVATNKISILLLKRSAICAILICSTLWLTGYANFIEEAAACFVVGFGIALNSVSASALRSFRQSSAIAKTSFIRALLALILATIGASTGFWHFAIAGEIIAAITAYAITRRFVAVFIRSSNPSNEQRATPGSSIGMLPMGASREGMMLLIAILCVSIPFYLDRLFVAGVYGAGTVGTYAFLMLFVSGANIFQGIIEQRLGPELIAMQQAGESTVQQVRLAAKWTAFSWAMIFGAILAAAILTRFGPLAWIGDKYGLAFSLFAATGFLCIFQVTTTLDWILQSNDKERSILVSASIYFIAVIVVALITYAIEPSITFFIISLAIAKLVHFLSQTIFVILISRKVA